MLSNADKTLFKNVTSILGTNSRTISALSDRGCLIYSTGGGIATRCEFAYFIYGLFNFIYGLFNGAVSIEDYRFPNDSSD